MFSRKIVISGNGAIEIRRNLVESVVERLVSIASGMFGKDFSLFNDVTRISRREPWRNGLFVEWKRPALFRLLGMVFSSNGNGLPFFAFWYRPSNTPRAAPVRLTMETTSPSLNQSQIAVSICRFATANLLRVTLSGR